MRDLSYFGSYTLLGTLLLASPLINSGTLHPDVIALTTFWIQLTILFLSITFLLSLLFHKDRFSYSWTSTDILPIAFFCLTILSYPYSIDPEPEKILFIGQTIILWFIFRHISN